MRKSKFLLPFLFLTLVVSANCSRKKSEKSAGGRDESEEKILSGDEDTDSEIDDVTQEVTDKAMADKAADPAVLGASEKGQFPEIVSSIFGGNGCPSAGTPVKAVMDNVTGHLSLEYPNLTAIAADTTLFRVFCRYSLSLNVPQNKQLVVQHTADAKVNIEATLPASGSTINGNYYFNSDFDGLANFTEIAVPAGNTQKLSPPLKANAVKSGCGTSEILHFAAVAQVPQGTGTLAVKSTGSFLFKLVPCP
ncbi:MAG TPA: DUF4360 domain-containing protein [Oligoflexus sp.]|uniref:DUF4360 domain-containing protein n=1 Tax=Oligoflexus sp. TaxID=1971216 RepID=UPI002D53071E|nr:DUF4360 domain-containing protein [Oligoflexus sp.]HYX35186.1 DUF4360 domain-containing protein [Oligoflexus sp.]